MVNEECKAARERAESIAVSHPPQSLPLRNDMSAGTVCVASLLTIMQGFMLPLTEDFILYIQSSIPDPTVTLLHDMFDM